MSVKVEVRMDTPSMTEFMLYHIYSSTAGRMTLVLGFVNIMFAVSLAVRGKSAYMALFILFALLLLVAFPLFIKNKVRKQMENATKLKESVIYEFDESGITTTTADDSGKISWGKFQSAVARKGILILYDAEKHAIILPVEQLGEAYGAVVEMIYAHMPARVVKIPARPDRK